jgi:hypothetical protein
MFIIRRGKGVVFLLFCEKDLAAVGNIFRAGGGGSVTNVNEK